MNDNDNPSQPSNDDASDMFRVLIAEATQMHPHYLRLKWLKYKFEGLRSAMGGPDKKLKTSDIKMVRHYIEQINAEFEAFK